jgi:hypothetical protein
VEYRVEILREGDEALLKRRDFVAADDIEAMRKAHNVYAEQADDEAGRFVLYRDGTAIDEHVGPPKKI